jgi:flagellar hook assembly protein FlgD
MRPVAANPSAAPGPIAFDLPGPGARPVTVAVYDVAGRLVAQLAKDVLDPGRHSITWDGTGANGRQAPAGVYWVRVTAGGEIAAARLTLVR